MCQLSIIIPTYNERVNVRLIVNRIVQALSDNPIDYEILFIDDSRDDTPDVLKELASLFPQVRYLHRENAKGLGTAVVEGFQLSRGRHLIVMDADLQHPPELIPLIYHRLSEIDVVIPSRFIQGGSDGGLNWLRKFVSWTARSIGRIFIKKTRNISDCTGGFFGLNRDVIEKVALDPIGWKILMEILVKGNYRTVHEIPYSFVARDSGESKMSINEQWNYLRHIARLMLRSPDDRRFYLFCFVGILGVIVNLFVFTILVNLLAIPSLLASAVASIVAMLHNFVWHDKLTWKDYSKTKLSERILQFPKFMVISTLGIALTTSFVQLFIMNEWNIYLGQTAGIIVGTLWNYFANKKWTWSNPSKKRNTRDILVTQEIGQQNSF
ncbi:glycosyltransferase [Paenibacillus sp. LMG 31456]|uniref:Glycosyltransferase n=1 Tax=Paenibacillus foliorum TaxID=2654974 RepID=A0A972K1N2_9BACL|nr:glycosyltransferase [Paenibacillus foliorum]NOU92977.1 glycosyltransferase [Paenibacillus foliorum]